MGDAGTGSHQLEGNGAEGIGKIGGGPGTESPRAAAPSGVHRESLRLTAVRASRDGGGWPAQRRACVSCARKERQSLGSPVAPPIEDTLWECCLDLRGQTCWPVRGLFHRLHLAESSCVCAGTQSLVPAPAEPWLGGVRAGNFSSGFHGAWGKLGPASSKPGRTQQVLKPEGDVL